MVSVYPAAAAAELAGRLEDCGALWIIGGSTGLALRGAVIGRAPRDLDIYADEEDAARIHARLADYALDQPSVSVTERYRSILSHYSFAGTPVELVGGFRIEAEGSRYRTEVRQLLYPAGDDCRVGGYAARLVPLGHELIFNVLRNRPDRCEIIGRLIRLHPERHLPALKELLRSNDMTTEAVKTVLGYAQDPADGKKAGLD